MFLLSDHLAFAVHRRVMSSIHSENTKPEIAVRRFLFRNGFRFRLHQRRLAGTPDIVLPRYGTAVFVNGCLWHGHRVCAKYAPPRTNRAYWKKKVRDNRKRDRRVKIRLKASGWKVVTVWGCEAFSPGILAVRFDRLLSLRFDARRGLAPLASRLALAKECVRRGLSRMAKSARLVKRALRARLDTVDRGKYRTEWTYGIGD
jgi:DNA mismatch endonuclease (patch repair protein)